MSAEEKQVFIQQMNARREQQKKAKEERKQEEPDNDANRGPAMHEEPARGLEAMMGLDDMGEMEIPEHLLPGGGPMMGGGAPGMTED